MGRSDAARRRHFASDRRAGVFARGKARRLQRALVRRRWRALMGMLLIMWTPGLMAAFMPNGFGQGLVVGVEMTAGVGVVAGWVVLMSGTAPTMMGELAEQWTAEELRRLQGDGWRVLNHVLVSNHGDLDHVVVGPGGVVVVETKWTSDWNEDRWGRAERAAESAREQAQRLRRWHEFKAVAPQVLATVSLWGSNPPAQYYVGEVLVGPGRELTAKISGLPQTLTLEQVDRIYEVIATQVEVRDLRERTFDIPRSAEELFWSAFGCLALGVMTAVAVVWPGVATSSLTIMWAVAIAIAAGAVFVRQRWRTNGMGAAVAVGAVFSATACTFYVGTWQPRCRPQISPRDAQGSEPRPRTPRALSRGEADPAGRCRRSSPLRMSGAGLHDPRRSARPRRVDRVWPDAAAN